MINSHGWKNNLHLSNGRIELIITLDVGPRIIHLAHQGGSNVFKEFSQQLGQAGESEWMIRGGHRFWISPETQETGYTYASDNVPVPYEKLGNNHYKITSLANQEDGWEKELEIKLEEGKDQVSLIHRIIATKDLSFPIAPWALTVMAAGGLAIIPQPERGNHPADLLPNRKMILWPYTDLQDSRYSLVWPNILVQQRQDPDTTPTKIGLVHQTGWVGYHVGDSLFAKSISYTPEANYPDMGVNFELFSNNEMLELESVAPLVTLKKNQSTEHHETWILKKTAAIDWNKTSLLDVIQN
jgi:hypothetical protein